MLGERVNTRWMGLSSPNARATNLSGSVLTTDSPNKCYLLIWNLGKDRIGSRVRENG